MICVLGMGNILLKDDGIGVRAAEELMKTELPLGIKIIDVGTGILKILPELMDVQEIIVLDAIKAGGEPGTVYMLNSIEAGFSHRRSVHDIQMEEVVGYLKLMGREPKVTYYGIEPGEIKFSVDLSPEVAEKVPVLASYVYDYIWERAWVDS